MTWTIVDQAKFNEYVRTYPRPLTQFPPAGQETRVRWWRDLTIGEGSDADVATANTSRRSHVCSVRTDLEHGQQLLKVWSVQSALNRRR